MIEIETALYTTSEFGRMMQRWMRLTIEADNTGSVDAKQALNQAARPSSSSM
jgi:hypothetical protein